MKSLTQDEMLELLCAPEPLDEPDESDFADAEAMDAVSIRHLLVKEMN
jgi:hypothetical protein